MSNRGPSMVLGGVEWGEGRYPVIRHYEDGTYYSVPLHRLTAYAHGEIEHWRFEECGEEVHHLDWDYWNSCDPDNLEGLPPADHGAITAEGLAADGGQEP